MDKVSKNLTLDVVQTEPWNASQTKISSRR